MPYQQKKVKKVDNPQEREGKGMASDEKRKDAADLISKESLDLTSSTPLYRQVAELIRSMITNRELAPGDKLPTEQRLSHLLDMSVSTIRSAYALLVDEGLVTRRAGRGSFVSKPQLSRQLKSLYTFTEDIRALGMSPSSKILDFHTAKPGADIAEALGISLEEDVYYIRRLRCANGNPILLEASSVPVRLCPGLTRDEVEGSLYEAIARHGESAPLSAREVHEASTLSEDEATLLCRKPGAGTFRITRLTTNTRGELCEHCLVVAPGDQTRYTIELGPNGSNAIKNIII